MLAAVDGDAPGDSRQPRLGIFHLRELRTVAQDSHERFLGGVFGIVVAAQDRIRDAVDQAGVVVDQAFEHVVPAFGPAALGFFALDRRYSAQDRLSRHHSFALTHEDLLGVSFVQEILRENGDRGSACAPKEECHSERLGFDAKKPLFCRRDEADSSLRSE